MRSCPRAGCGRSTSLTPDERKELLRLCDEAVETYAGRRGRKLYDHRRIALGDISGTARYELFKRAGYRCELCGISAEERALEVETFPFGTELRTSAVGAFLYGCPNTQKRGRERGANWIAIAEGEDQACSIGTGQEYE